MERKERIHEFHIVSNVAYDYMEIEEELISLMDKIKVVCFTVPWLREKKRLTLPEFSTLV
ncbi:hypothetical protein J7K43_04325 [Candidatus Calescamantes bacterium]|nr:hypothetical protein [Candidatus Calescamantes bacterium]